MDICANYLLKYKQYLAYDEYLAAGLPIGSGVIEGACRHLVKDRLALTGARWGLTGAEAVLRLRALRSSNDFEQYWRFHEASEYERNHRARYADVLMGYDWLTPPEAPPSGSNLRPNTRIQFNCTVGTLHKGPCSANRQGHNLGRAVEAPGHL